ncbi:hypothetical protein ACEWY4_019533 [Coilia grayii]|uniref:Ig-like domain-containing protein n=1 Tax=Coilia grayii TaxID=363190 RepID=A0ABD1JCG1_9TELE
MWNLKRLDLTEMPVPVTSSITSVKISSASQADILALERHQSTSTGTGRVHLSIHTNRTGSLRKDKMYAVWVAALLLLTAVRLTSGAKETVVVVYAQLGQPAQFLTDPSQLKDGFYRRWYFAEKFSGPYEEMFFRHSLGQSQITPSWKDWIQVSDDDSLTLKNVNDSNFAYFKYELKEKQDKSIDSVYKLHKVTLTPNPSSAVLYGQSLTLTCDVQTSQVSTTITWIRPKTADEARKTRGSGGKILPIEKVSWRDEGVWTCSVHYDRRTSNATTTVRVVDLSPAPSEPVYTSASTAPLGLPCSLVSPVEWKEVRSKGLQGGNWSYVPASDPRAGPRVLATLSLEPTLQWTIPAGSKMDGSALQKAPQGNNLSLSKKEVTAQDRGTYTCALSFGKGVHLMRAIKVEVLQVLVLPNSKMFEGQRVNLTCTLGPGGGDLGDLEVKWVPPKAASLPSLGPPPHPASLSIPKASVGHSGTWKCELWRKDTRLTYASLPLKIERVPVDVWLWVGIASTGLIIILLIFIGRSLVKRFRQRRPPRRKTRFCCCNNPKPQKGFYRT